MTLDVYRDLAKCLSNRGLYSAVDIPEFYDVVEALFDPVEASVYVAIPAGSHPAARVAQELDRPVDTVAAVLEQMADKGLCTACKVEGVMHYQAPPLIPGIFEYQFMRGTFSKRDKQIARLVQRYKAAVDRVMGKSKVSYPPGRVIPVNQSIQAEQTIHTYQQVKAYIETNSPLSVSTCYCRHEAKLVDAQDDCGHPTDVCLQFGSSAQYAIDRGLGREIDKTEALSILQRCEKAGLVHATANRQEIDFLCNCCACHCLLLKTALDQPRPGKAMNSGFQPMWDEDLCTACGVCSERCPTTALSMMEASVPHLDLDRCIGCGICASGCPAAAVELIARPDVPKPPLDGKAYRAAIQFSNSRK